jgi:hypothetical protein
MAECRFNKSNAPSRRCVTHVGSIKHLSSYSHSDADSLWRHATAAPILHFGRPTRASNSWGTVCATLGVAVSGWVGSEFQEQTKFSPGWICESFEESIVLSVAGSLRRDLKGNAAFVGAILGVSVERYAVDAVN